MLEPHSLKRRIRHGLALLIMVVALECLLCWLSKPDANARQAQAVTIKLEGPTSVRAHDARTSKFFLVISNNGAKDVMVCRFARSIYVAAYDNQNREVTQRPVAHPADRVGVPLLRDIVSLQPGESVRIIAHLGWMPTDPAPGKYKLSVTMFHTPMRDFEPDLAAYLQRHKVDLFEKDVQAQDQYELVIN